MAHNVKEPALCSLIATKDNLECLEYLAVLHNAYETRYRRPTRPFLYRVLIVIS